MFVLGRVCIVDNGTFKSVLSFLPPVKLPKCCEIFAIAGKGLLCQEWSVNEGDELIFNFEKSTGFPYFKR